MSGRGKICALALAGALAVLGTAAGAEESEIPPRVKWSFAGPFGIYDQAQLQRGFKIYREVCQACHSLSLLAFRNLAEPGGPGFSAAQAKTIAAEYKINDGPNEQGEMFERPGRPADHFPSPYPNEQAARAAQNGVLPPDLSMIAKARGYERGGIYRRHAGRPPALCPGRHRVPAVGGRAAPGRAQAPRTAGDDLPRGIRRAVVFHQEEGVVERARPRVMRCTVVAGSP